MKKYSDKRKAAIVEAYKSREESLSAREFAQKHKVPVRTIWAWVGKEKASSEQTATNKTKPVNQRKRAPKRIAEQARLARSIRVAGTSGLGEEAKEIISDLLFENYMLKRKLGMD